MRHLLQLLAAHRPHRSADQWHTALSRRACTPEERHELDGLFGRDR